MLDTLRTIAIVVLGLLIGAAGAAAIAPDPTSLLGMTITIALTVGVSYIAYRLDDHYFGTTKSTR